ncbi:MAG: DUF5615 family PIN-like protein [Anaerolineales bacterium]|nr:DUF5615 family PIN-like protein [Chloroflexota bacterium]MBL6983394.1 DUF5615 family PIN-like protein [Anaerolineales bacterium]
MPQADDIEALEFSHDEKRTLFTIDQDFGELVYRGGFEYYGVVLLRHPRCIESAAMLFVYPQKRTPENASWRFQEWMPSCLSCSLPPGQSHIDFLSGKSPSGSEAQPRWACLARTFSLIRQPTRLARYP